MAGIEVKVTCVLQAGNRDVKAVLMREQPKVESERRDRQRFRVNAPVSMLIDGQSVWGVTRDMSNRGLYFYVASVEDLRCGQILDLTVELPPELTLSTGCQIRCAGRIVRIEKTPADLIGVAAEILDYSIMKSATSSK